jgi:hypothetical protein
MSEQSRSAQVAATAQAFAGRFGETWGCGSSVFAADEQQSLFSNQPQMSQALQCVCRLSITANYPVHAATTGADLRFLITMLCGCSC